MNGRTLAGLALLVLGVGVAAVGSYELATGAGAPFGSASGATASTPTAAPSPGSSLTSGAAPTGVGAPTAAAAPAPAPELTPEPSPTVGSDADTAVRAFFTDLVAAIRNGDIEAMGARLNGAVIDRYGSSTCEAKLASDQADPAYAIEILEIHQLSPWDYVTDDRTTSIPEVWTVDATVTAAGQAATRELHVAPMDGGVSWFTDCGDPLPAP